MGRGRFRSDMLGGGPEMIELVSMSGRVGSTTLAREGAIEGPRSESYIISSATLGRSGRMSGTSISEIALIMGRYPNVPGAWRVRSSRVRMDIGASLGPSLSSCCSRVLLITPDRGSL